MFQHTPNASHSQNKNVVVILLLSLDCAEHLSRQSVGQNGLSDMGCWMVAPCHLLCRIYVSV